LGVLFLFDAGLLAMGNLLFLGGLALIIGLQRLRLFFFQMRKLKGTVCFLGGILVVFLGWPVIGMIIEMFGFINLFGYFFPVILSVARQLHILGTLLILPVIRQVSYGAPASP